MDAKEAIPSAIKELVPPELNFIKEKQIRTEERKNSIYLHLNADGLARRTYAWTGFMKLT